MASRRRSGLATDRRAYGCSRYCPSYRVIYYGNTNTGGIPPTDESSPYRTSSIVTILGNAGSLARAGYNFAGWNTVVDGSGTSYVQGNTFTITANTRLYAQWTPMTPPSAPIITGATPSSTSIQITFTAPYDGGSPITNYEYSLNGGSSWTPFSPVDTTSPVTVSGLTSGQTYTLYLRAVNSVGAGPASNAVTRTTLAVPGAPSSLSVIPGDKTIDITFTAPSDGGSPITNYQYSLNGGTSWTSFSPIDTASPVTITGLTNGTVYNIKLRAVNAVGSGAASSQIDIAPFPGNSFAPADIDGLNLWLDGQYSSSVDISGNIVSVWEDKSGSGNDFTYGGAGTINYSQPSGINNRPAIHFATSSSTYLSRSFNISPSNNLSLFMVVNHVSTGTSGNSELFFSKAGPTTPGYAYFDLFSNTNTPTGLLSINIGDDDQVSTDVDIRGEIALIDVIATGTTDIYVNGTQTNNNISRGPLSLNNMIQWAISGGAFQGFVGEVIVYPSGLSDIDRQKVEGYLAWKWGLQANLPNTQPYKNAPPITLAAPVITGITASARSLSVAFTQDATSVTITNYQYSTDNGATFRALATPNVVSPLTITTLSSDGTTLLANGVTYDVIIQAKTADGVGLVSNMVQGTTPFPSAPDTPTVLSSVPGNQAAYILFTQGGSVPVDNYQYSTDDGNTFFLLNPPQTYSPIVINTLSSDGVTLLTNNVDPPYKVKLRAMNDGSRSGISNSIDVVPETTSLVSSNRIIYLDANNPSSYSLDVSGNTWTNLESAGAYSATLNGGPTFNNTDPSNNYFVFNPGTVTGQFAQITQAAAINPVPNQPFTIQLWVRINNVGSQGTLVSKMFGGSGDYDGYNLVYRADTALQLHLNGSNRDNYFRSGIGVLRSGWTLYTANIQFGNAGGRKNNLFVNGRQVLNETSNETSIPRPTQNLTFPAGFGGDGICDVGEFYYYNTELSQYTIIQNYDATKSRYM